mgnify:CR=1 FL=1
MNRMFGWAGAVPLVILATVFAISNRQGVRLDLWPVPLDVPVPLFLAVLAPLALGVAAGAALTWLAARPCRRRVTEQQRRIESLERQLGAARGRPEGR